MVENKTVSNMRINMGFPYFEMERIHAYLPSKILGDSDNSIIVEIEKENYSLDLVSVGNPHAVCFVEDVSKVCLEKLGKTIENYPYFPNRINVEITQVIDKNNLKTKVWERGVGKTLSCGTGACACSVCAIKRNLVNPNVTVQLDGGRLHVSYNEKKGIELVGGAEFCYEGRIDL